MPTNIDGGLIGRRSGCISLGLALALTGCGGGGASSSPIDLKNTILEIGPNGGPVVQLDNATNAEITQQFSSKGTFLRVTLLESDLSTSASVSPSEVSAKVYTMSGEQGVRFSADSSSSHVWDSPPGEFSEDELQGELTIVLDGESITKPFAFR